MKDETSAADAIKATEYVVYATEERTLRAIVRAHSREQAVAIADSGALDEEDWKEVAIDLLIGDATPIEKMR